MTHPVPNPVTPQSPAHDLLAVAHDLEELLPQQAMRVKVALDQLGAELRRAKAATTYAEAAREVLDVLLAEGALTTDDAHNLRVLASLWDRARGAA